MLVNPGLLRQAAVIAAWLAAGLLLGGLMRLEAERILRGDRQLWTQPSDF